MPPYSRDEILNKLREFVGSRPGPWSQADFLDEYRLSHRPVRRLFGSW